MKRQYQLFKPMLMYNKHGVKGSLWINHKNDDTRVPDIHVPTRVSYNCTLKFDINDRSLVDQIIYDGVSHIKTLYGDFKCDMYNRYSLDSFHYYIEVDMYLETIRFDDFDLLIGYVYKNSIKEYSLYRDIGLKYYDLMGDMISKSNVTILKSLGSYKCSEKKVEINEDELNSIRKDLSKGKDFLKILTKYDINPDIVLFNIINSNVLHEVNSRTVAIENNLSNYLSRYDMINESDWDVPQSNKVMSILNKSYILKNIDKVKSLLDELDYHYRDSVKNMLSSINDSLVNIEISKDIKDDIVNILKRELNDKIINK